MEKAFAKAEELAGTIKEYVNTTIESAKLNAAEKSSAIIANTMAGAIAAVVFILFIVFAGIALALGLGEWLQKIWAGFLIVAALYLLLGILVWNAREKLLRLPIMNAFIKQLFTSGEDEED
ncbi:phage holin family protein [Ferruginibacter profundus]